MLCARALGRLALVPCLTALLAGALHAAVPLGGDVDADSCAAADVIAGTGTFTFDNAGATTDGPASCAVLGSDVWAVWTAPQTGLATVETCGLTGLDSVLAVYEGTACFGPLLACNDDACGLQSRVVFPVTGGGSYLLRIGGFNGAQGSGSFSVELDTAAGFVSADDCGNADPISGFGVFGFSNVGATTDGAPPPGCAGFGNPQINNDVWAVWTSPITGTATMSTCGLSVLDTKIAAYQSALCGGPLLACNDDTCGFQSEVSFPVQAGSRYLLRVGTFAEDEEGAGAFTLTGDPAADVACEEFDRFVDLTPNDTFTTITRDHNPQQEQGFAFAYAVEGSQAIGFDHLIGQQLVFDGIEALEYSVNTVTYEAMGADFVGTDLDADGIRDLNGVEYQKTAGEILVPRFLGQSDRFSSELILLSLSGGAAFDTTADLLVYNDDEEQFSAQVTFRCWDRVPLLSISNVFHNVFLRDFSGDDPAEGLGPNQEYGWFRLFGDHASSTFFDLLDPAVYGVLIERTGGTAAADLPFERCIQSGHLLPRVLQGDNEEIPGALSDQSCNVSLARNEPASLLVYPEFDNRSGVATVFTVTNTNSIYDTRVHFVYVGRYGN